MIRYFKLFCILIFVHIYLAHANSDYKVISSNAQSMIIEWELKDFIQNHIYTDQKLYKQISFSGSKSSFEQGQPDIPHRPLRVGVPPGGSAQAQIISRDQQTLSDINIAPVFIPFRADRKKSATGLRENQQIYAQDQLFPASTISMSEVTKFRDIETQTIQIFPFQYNPVRKTLVYATKIRIRITFNNPRKIANTYRERGKLDRLYKDMLINFDQAKQWQAPGKK